MQVSVNVLPLFVIITIFCWNFVNSLYKPENVSKMLYNFFMMVLLILTIAR